MEPKIGEKYRVRDTVYEVVSLCGPNAPHWPIELCQVGFSAEWRRSRRQFCEQNHFSAETAVAYVTEPWEIDVELAWFANNRAKLIR